MVQKDGTHSVAPAVVSVFPRELPSVVHGFTTRQGGNGLPPFDTLNLGDHVGDDTETVIANRTILSSVMDIPAHRWVTAEQVHGGDVALVGEDQAGRKIPGVDALITRTPQLPLALMYADCLSLFLIDPVQQAIGLAHAGWRGTVAQIGPRTVNAMKASFGSEPENLQVAFGPHIGPCCYTVGEEVAKQLSRWEGAIREKGVGWRADLRAANRTQLLENGVASEFLDDAVPCTACESDRFFSYRREGRTGRMAALLMLAG